MGLGYNEKEFYSLTKGRLINVPKIKQRKFGKNKRKYTYLKTYISKNTAESRKETLKGEGYNIRITEGIQRSGANKGKTVYRVWGTLWKKASKKPKQRKRKTIKLKSFSIGRGDAKASFKNIKRMKWGSMPMIYYSVDVYGKKGLKNKELLIHSKNKKELRKGLEKMYPHKVRKNLM